MRHISEPSRYNVNHTNVYLVNVVSGQYRPLQTKMELKTAEQYYRNHIHQYTYPYTLYVLNDRVRPHSELIKEFCNFIMNRKG